MKYLFISLCLLVSIYFSSAQPNVKKLTLEEKKFESASGQIVEGQVGSLKVLENRANSKSEEITIHFVRLKSTNPNPKTPIIYLEGGPGSSCTWQASNKGYLENWLPYLELGDVILLDQRGTGAGTQRVLYIWEKEIPENVLLNEITSQKHFKNVSEQALISFNNRGVDLNGYTTLENAKDIDALRIALNYKKIDLFGFSYGTHLGQTYIKYFGDFVNNAVLVGVEGLNHTFKLPSSMDTQFHKIALLANADPNINKEIPDLIALYKKVVQKLEKKPITLTLTSPLTNASMKIKISSYALNLMLRFDIGDASDIPVFPRLLYSIDQEDYSILKWFVQKRIQFVFGIQAMSATMDPASGATANRYQRIKEEEAKSFFKNTVNPQREVNWSTPDLGDTFRAPLISNIRTLFMSGTLDFNTPPYQAEEVRWGFSNSSHIIVNNAGHEQILTHPDASKTIIRFLKGENVDDTTLSHSKIQFIPVKGASEKLWHPSIK